MSLLLCPADETLAVFRHEHVRSIPRLIPSPQRPLAVQAADEWENGTPQRSVRRYSGNTLRTWAVHRVCTRQPILLSSRESPRADGNCGILAAWAVEAAHGAGRTAQVIYPHDLDIHCCIGCYQCYNTGSCVFDDDMTGIINAIRGASLIIVMFTGLYQYCYRRRSNWSIDRTQAYHAERALYGGRTGQKGLIFSVAGRKGEDNFTCITRVVIGIFPQSRHRAGGQVRLTVPIRSGTSGRSGVWSRA